MGFNSSFKGLIAIKLPICCE